MSCDKCGENHQDAGCGQCTLILNIPPNPEGNNQSEVIIGTIGIPRLGGDMQYLYMNFSFQYDGSRSPSILSYTPTTAIAGQEEAVEV